MAISYDPVETLRKFAEKKGIGYLLLSDKGSATIDAYGIRNRQATGRTVGIPHPTVFIVDGDGVIRARLMHEGFRDRVSKDQILEAAAGLNGSR